MGNGNYVQTSFLGGEWSPIAQGRMDDPRYKTALATCLNSLPLEEGAWTRRPGFRRVGTTRSGAEANILPFEATDTAPYNIELTNAHLRIISGHNIVADEEAFVSAISSATPAVVTLTAAVTWATNDQVIFRFLTDAAKIACARLANRVFKVTRSSSTNFRLSDPITSADFDGSLLSSFTSSEVVMARVLDLSTPYTGTSFRDVVPVQSEEDCILLQRNTKPQVLTYNSGDEETADFEINPAVFLDGPYLDPFTGSLATPSGTTGVISITLGFSAYSATKAYKKGDYVTSVGIGYKSLQDNNVGHTPASSATYWEVVSFGDPVGPSGFSNSDTGRLVRLFSAGTTWTWGRITGPSTTGFIDPSVLTKIGDMTGGGGLAALFDGDTAKAADDCGQKSSTNSAYGGIVVGVASTVRSVIIYPCAETVDDEIWGDVGRSKLTFELYAKNGTPSSSTDGDLLGTLAAPNAPDEPFTITSSNVVTTYTNIWVRMSCSGGTAKLAASQFQFFNASGSPGISVNVEILGSDLASTAACVWRLGVYGDGVGWPTCGCYSEGRLWLGGAVPNRFDASNANDIFNFAPTNAAGTVGDANAISYTLNAKDVNPLYWMEPNAQGIVAGTRGGEWLITSTSETNNMGPTTTKARRVTKYKCADAQPVTLGVSTVFIQKAKRNILEFISDIFSGKFFAPNLNELARHMSTGNFEEICGQDGLTPIVWARRADGKFVGATYKRLSMHSSEPPKFLGWHRHELGTGFDVTSIARASSDDGLQETLSIITKDEDNIYYVSHMAPLFDPEDEIGHAMHLDDAIVPIIGTTVTVGSTEYVRFSGLDAFNTLRLPVFAAGVDCGDLKIENGVVDVPLTGLFTRDRMLEVTTDGEDYGTLAVPINGGEFTIPAIVGYNFNSDAQQVRPFRMEDTGARAGVAFAKTKRSHKHAMLLHKTQGLSVGTDFTKLRPVRFRTPGQEDYALTQLYSGMVKDMLDDTYSLDSMVCWRVSRPYPATVCASGAFLATQDE